MRRFLIIFLACALGLATAFAFAFVAKWARPCQGEQLTCSMTDIIGLIYVPVFSLVALIACAIAVFWKASARALNVALALPLAAVLALIGYVKYSEFSVREFHDVREKDIVELLRVFIPIVLTLVVPWVTLSRWLELKRAHHG